MPTYHVDLVMSRHSFRDMPCAHSDVFFYFTVLCSLLFVCCYSSSGHACLTKEDRKPSREQVSLFFTDTILMVNLVTNEKSYRVTKNVRPMTPQESKKDKGKE